MIYTLTISPAHMIDITIDSTGISQRYVANRDSKKRKRVQKLEPEKVRSTKRPHENHSVLQLSFVRLYI